jgi:hypothetical protein
VVKRAPAKKDSLAAINAAAAAAPVAGGGHTREVFDEIPERCVSIFLSGKFSLFAVNLIVCSFAVQPSGFVPGACIDGRVCLYLHLTSLLFLEL